MNNHRPRKRFGQNFLHDANIIANIVAAIDPRSGQRIIEIGPGKGALTRPLLEHCGKLEVIELDRDLVPVLEAELASLGELRIYQEDVLKFDFNRLQAEPRSMRIVGNLPYNISTPLLFHLMNYLPLIKDMHFMLQKEVVERICAHPGNKDYGRLSVMLQFYCDTADLFNVPPGAFYPPPSVNSAIVRLIPHAEKEIAGVDQKTFATIVQAAFAQRRKTLRNNLKTYLSDEDLRSLDIDPACRAETLDLSAFKRLAVRFQHKYT